MDFVVICHENKGSPECELRYFNTSIESCGAAEFTVPCSEQPTCHHSIPVLPPCAANVIFCHLEFCKQNFILWHVACTENTIFQLSKVCTIYYIYSTRTKYNVQQRVDTGRQLAGLPPSPPGRSGSGQAQKCVNVEGTTKILVQLRPLLLSLRCRLLATRSLRGETRPGGKSEEL